MRVQALAPETAIHDAVDEELDASGMPAGWLACPKMGKPVWRFIPMKVPLGAAFNGLITDPRDRFSVEDAVDMVKEMLRGATMQVAGADGQLTNIPAECNMVIDLTNSNRYYRRETWEDLGFYHLKIPNRGRGEVPAPQAVNDFVFEVQSHISANPAGYILVHCTHGFNRTGYMIVSHLLRMLSDETTTVEKVLCVFDQARPPGIYKEYYRRHLFRYYHQLAPKDFPPALVPDWKVGTSPDEGDEEVDDADIECCEGDHLQHDDVIGEAVCASEANWVRGILMQYVMGRDCQNGEGVMFPGSQPVSLARSNLNLLNERRYWVTWKADGTRYLLFLHKAGTYLIDRSNAVRRAQMRWPLPLPAHVPGQPAPKAPIGGLHMGTILDGEMVVDEDLVSGKRTRRFLAYDAMVINSTLVSQRPWIDRWNYIEQFVEAPRRLEAKEIMKGKWKMRYDYSSEPFRFRRKAFWPLSASKKIIDDFIANQLSHEADGLILQPHDDPYIPLTCHELLKWKFAHMNSVDFKLRIAQDGTLALQLLHPTKHGSAVVKDLEGAKVQFSEEDNPIAYDGKIIECAWDKEQCAWRFMRDRRDKALPNAETVYQKVWASIQDDIKEDDLLQAIEAAQNSRAYDADRN